MTDSFYRISCWLHNRKGQSFAVEIWDGKEGYVGRHQAEAGEAIASIRLNGKIDQKLPFEEFSVSAEMVDSLLKKLADASVCPVPAITGGFDGANYHLAVKNGESLIHCSWWMECPKGWEPLKDFWESVVALPLT